MADAQPPEPALIIREAPTGAGKTDAALNWRLLSSGQAEAVVFALPIQATASAMLARAIAFASQACGQANAVLAHGHAGTPLGRGCAR